MSRDQASEPRVAVTSAWSIALLGWIGAIKATGASLATIALVDASRSLEFTSAERAVAASAGTLALAATVIASGQLADRIGRRRVLMGSLALAALGSMVVSLSFGFGPYLIGQIVTGVGFGAMFAGSFAYVRTVAPGAKLGWALGLFGAYCTLLAAVASVAGGYLSDATWRALFLVVPVMCVVAWVATPRLLPLVPPVPDVGGDAVGLILLGVGMVSLLVGTSQATFTYGWSAWGPVGAGFIVLAIWVWWEVRSDRPAFPVRLFASGPFAAAALVGVTFNMVQAANSLQLSNYWQFIDGQSAFVVSMEMQPFYVVGVLGALVAGRLLSSGRSPRGIMTASCLITAVGFLAIVPISQDASYWAYLPAVVLIGIGMLAGTTAQGQVFVQEAPSTSYGAVTASRSTMGQVGFAFGFALSAVLMDRLTNEGVVDRMRDAGASPQSITSGLTAVQSFVKSGQDPTGAAAQQALTDAGASLHQALDVLMLVCAAVMVLSALVVWVVCRPRTSW